LCKQTVLENAQSKFAFESKTIEEEKNAQREEIERRRARRAAEIEKKAQYRAAVSIKYVLCYICQSIIDFTFAFRK
jgi:RNase P subunit RPR2